MDMFHLEFPVEMLSAPTTEHRLTISLRSEPATRGIMTWTPELIAEARRIAKQLLPSHSLVMIPPDPVATPIKFNKVDTF